MSTPTTSQQDNEKTLQPQQPLPENAFVQILAFEELSHCEVKLQALPKAALLEKARERAQDAVKREVSVPGFRKGKAPMRIIEERFSKQIQSELLRQVNEELFRSATQLVGAAPSRQSEIESSPSSHDLMDPEWNICYKYEKINTFKLPNPEDLHLSLPAKPAVDEHRIDEHIKQLRLQHADWKEIEGRMPQEGEYVVLDIDDVSANKIIMQNELIHLADECPRKLKDLICSMNIGEERSHTFSPQDLRTKDEELDEEIAQNQVTLRIKLSAIRETILPELDEAFATRFQESSMEALQEKVREIITTQMDEQYDSMRRYMIRQRLLELSGCVLPQSMREKIKKFILDQGKPKNKEVFLRNFIAQEDHLRWGLLRDALWQQYKDKLAVSQQDFTKAMLNEMQLLMQGQSNYFSDFSEMQTEKGVAHIKEKLEEQLLIDYIWDLSKNEVPVEHPHKHEHEHHHRHVHGKGCGEGCSH